LKAPEEAKLHAQLEADTMIAVDSTPLVNTKVSRDLSFNGNVRIQQASKPGRRGSEDLE